MEFGLGEEEVVEGGGSRIKAQVLTFVAEYFDSLEHKSINSNNFVLLVTPPNLILTYQIAQPAFVRGSMGGGWLGL